MINRAEALKKRKELKLVIDYLSCARYDKQISDEESYRIEKALKQAKDKYRFYNCLLKTPMKKENEDDRNRISINTK